MTVSDQLLDALGDVGLDLVDMAERTRFPKSFPQRAWPLAACMALLLSTGLFFQPYKKTSPPAADLAPAIETQEIPAPELPRQDYYILELTDLGRFAAADANGTILVENHDFSMISMILDYATNETLGFLATPGASNDSDYTSEERIVCDLQGQEQFRINARNIQVLGDIAALEHEFNSFSLYHLDGTLIRDHLTSISMQSDCIVAHTQDETMEVYSSTGQLLLTLPAGHPYDQWNHATVFAKEDELGRWGVVNNRGTWIVYPDDMEISSLSDGHITFIQDGRKQLLELETGRLVEIPENHGIQVLGNQLLWRKHGESASAFWVTDWAGNTIIPTAGYIQAITNGGNGQPELYLAWKNSSTVICYNPDGAELLRLSEVGSVTPISSRSLVYTKTIQDPVTEEWVADFAIIDLKTGQGNREFEKPYTRAEALTPYEDSTGLFYAWYEDSDGVIHQDLLYEDGRVLLEDLQCNSLGGPYLGGDVFLTAEGYRHLDGSWLYAFAPSP